MRQHDKADVVFGVFFNSVFQSHMLFSPFSEGLPLYMILDLFLFLQV